MENSGGEGGLAILEFGGQGGDKHFGISEGKGGLYAHAHTHATRGRVWIFSGITQYQKALLQEGTKNKSLRGINNYY